MASPTLSTSDRDGGRPYRTEWRERARPESRLDQSVHRRRDALLSGRKSADAMQAWNSGLDFQACMASALLRPESRASRRRWTNLVEPIQVSLARATWCGRVVHRPYRTSTGSQRHVRTGPARRRRHKGDTQDGPARWNRPEARESLNEQPHPSAHRSNVIGYLALFFAIRRTAMALPGTNC